MQLTFWGVRGSVPTPELENSRYGGNTACLELRLTAGHSLVLDAGLGLRWLGLDMMGRQTGGNRLDILLSNCHWDHIQGLPFTPQMYLPDNDVHIHGPGPDLLATLRGQLRSDFCPVPNFFAENVGARVSVHPLPEENWLTCAGLRVRWAALPRTPEQHNWVVGYRVEAPGLTLAYLTDVHYTGGAASCAAAVELARGADVLVHDAQRLEREVALDGHSSYHDALDLGRCAGVQEVICTHHDPARSDAELDRVQSWLDSQTGLRARVAYEGLQITS